MNAKAWFYGQSFHDSFDRAEPETAPAGLASLLEASPRLHQVLQDLKRLEKYMSTEEKERVVTLVKKALEATK